MREGDEDGAEVTFEPRKPGTSSALVLNWLPYFQPTWADIQSAAQAVKLANGEKPVISQRTSVEAMASIFGVTDVDSELRQMGDEKQRDIEEAREAMEADFAMRDEGGENDEGTPKKPGDPGGAGGGKGETAEARQKGKEEKAT